jgi:single-strand DNA-binding protein
MCIRDSTVTGKLNKDAKQFAAGEYTGFNIRVGVKFYDRETKDNQWTNYSAVIFSNNQSQIQFLQGALVAGSVVELFGESIKVDTFTKDDGQTLITLELNNSRLGYIGTPENAQPQQNQAPQQSSKGFHNPPTKQQPQQMPDRQGKDRVWTHAELLAQGATIEQINKMPIIEDNIPF